MGRREWSKRGNEQDKRGSRHGGVGGGGEGGAGGSCQHSLAGNLKETCHNTTENKRNPQLKTFAIRMSTVVLHNTI